ncbi:D-2-hydroxyacid dehydrogenase [Defluviitalea phaphyphila]|uniref:D-2-hydroxyacid dehydrogenase n=1 Tax=Defluviitalea phaphyphila TaxID=1473580 RepID=UPI000730E583|nr:D-2-hydroxyacid dehydrogenase [Defluviitalea phaphyphila]
MKIVSSLSIGDEKLDLLKSKYPFIDFCIYKDIKKVNKEDLKEAEVFLTYGFDTDNSVIDNMPNLKWLHCMSTGIDKLPFDKLKEKNILLTNVTGIHGIPISEYVMGVILNKRIEAFNLYNQQKNKVWKRKMNYEEIYNKTITIIGTGSIGKEIAKKAKAFYMNTIGINTNGKKVEYFDEIFEVSQLNEALSKGDFIVNTVPLTKRTRKMIGKEQFESMKNTAYFINIGRGETVDENALIQALKDNIIGGAALDVFEVEPLPKDSPLWEMENVYITPHISGLSDKYMDRAFPIFIKNLQVYIERKGEYINKIDLNKQY